MAETPADNQDDSTTPGEAAAAAVDPGSAQAAMSRQKMLTGATIGVGALMGAIITVPVAVAALAPAFKPATSYPIDIGPERLYPPIPSGQVPWHEVTLEDTPDDTNGLSRRLVFIRNDGNDKFTAIANTCMHLGCPVRANATGRSPARATAASTTPRASAPPARRYAR